VAAAAERRNEQQDRDDNNYGAGSETHRKFSFDYHILS
jgi:hypothetical protein